MPAFPPSSSVGPSGLASATAAMTLKAFGGSKLWGSATVGVGLEDEDEDALLPSPPGGESDFLSSPPLHPASSTAAAVTATNGRNIVSFSPRFGLD
jgi:hypothetical protein